MRALRWSGTVLAVAALVLLPLLASQASARTINTAHYEFSPGSGWNEAEEKVIEEIARNLDSIWTQVNEALENALPPNLKFAITHEGVASRSIREANKVLLNALHIKNRNLRDCLDRVAHETAHIALHRLSNGKLTQWENVFLDEGIALYIGYRYVGELAELNALSQKIAGEDRQTGRASLAYLRDWEKNVREKQRQFVNTWKRQHPGREPSLDDFLKGGYRTYFTAYSFVDAVMSKHGLPRLLQVVRNVGTGMSQVDAFKMATGQSLDACVAEWHAALA